MKIFKWQYCLLFAYQFEYYCFPSSVNSQNLSKTKSCNKSNFSLIIFFIVKYLYLGMRYLKNSTYLCIEKKRKTKYHIFINIFYGIYTGKLGRL